MSRRRRQELYCHACNGYVQFVVDLEADGNHVLHCPSCGHEHCRVVKDGVITDIRWDSRNGPTYAISTGATSYSTTAVIWTSSSASTNTAAYANIYWSS